MNHNEERVLKEIINYYQDYKIMPTRRYLQKALGYKSVNSITYYIKSLEKKNYLERNINNKLIINNITKYYNDNLKKIKLINNNDYIDIILNKHKNYLAYKITNNYFIDMGIIKNDILIIERKKELKTNDLGLFIIDNKYRIMKYDYQDGFYLLKDIEELVLNRIKLLGKVIMIERKL